MNLVSSSLSTAYLSQLLGAGVTSVEPLDGGHNSRVFKVTAEDNSVYAAKLYPGPTADGKNRMTAEFTALEFLRQRDIDCVPRPVASDPSRQCAVYEFIEGAKALSSEATTADIDQMCRFLLQLNELKGDPESVRLPDAAESCFSIQTIVSNLEYRLVQLQNAEGSSPWFGELQGFLATELVPAFRGAASWCRNRVTSAGMAMDTELSREDRTLSPSDFGFHNCLRRSNSQLVFLDFEYFGWDDLAKMICDFLLHPAMELSFSLKRRFAATMIGTPNPDKVLLERVETVYPLFCLKWCLILLNPFLSRYRLQRGIGGLTGTEQDDLLERQLAKGKLMLSIIGSGYERFPYRDERYACNVI